MNLFQMKNYKLEISPEAYTLEPFKKIWDRDKSKYKETALSELAYIYFMCDYKSDFMNILDEDKRSLEIIKVNSLNDKWKPDKIIKDGIQLYKSRIESITLKMLYDARHAIERLSTYIRDIRFEENEIDERTGEIKPKHDIKKFVDTIKQIPQVVQALKLLEEEVKKETETSDQLRGNRKKGMYAD